MIYIEENKIQDMYLGETKISKAYLGTDLVYQEGEEDTGYASQYLTLTALAPTTITAKGTNYLYVLQYSTDGNNWQEISLNNNIANIVTLNVGEYVLLRSTSSGESNGIKLITINGTGNYSASGNIMSLIYSNKFKRKTNLNGRQNAFMNLFLNSTTLVSAENLILPASTIEYRTYYQMFKGCTSLVSPPELPATYIGVEGYSNMFSECTSLTTIPNLPALYLNSKCYESMFKGCTSLVNAGIDLPATTLKDYCYRSMFYNCSSLTIVPRMLATQLAYYCYSSMFSGCTSLTVAPELPITNLANGCYRYMFEKCTSLTTAPVLPALALVSNCYYYMFWGCTSLNYIKAMFTSPPNTAYTNSWVYGVAENGTFVKNVIATWNSIGDYAIPSGWTVETASY